VRVEDSVRATGSAEIGSHDVGLAILGPLRELDEVAYLRFASVYRSFDSLDDFESEIAALRTERDQKRGDTTGQVGAGAPAPRQPEAADRGPDSAGAAR
jgi:transcriptional repressor NrdR